MMGLSWIQNRYSRFDTKSSEEFNTASRSVKPGLIAAGIVSAWTWAATLLQSATVGYRYGVAGKKTTTVRCVTAYLLSTVRALLVRRRSDSTDPHVLNSGLQD